MTAEPTIDALSPRSSDHGIDRNGRAAAGSGRIPVIGWLLDVNETDHPPIPAQLVACLPIE